jgi:hypothetical protein
MKDWFKDVQFEIRIIINHMYAARAARHDARLTAGGSCSA